MEILESNFQIHNSFQLFQELQHRRSRTSEIKNRVAATNRSSRRILKSLNR